MDRCRTADRCAGGSRFRHQLGPSMKLFALWLSVLALTGCQFNSIKTDAGVVNVDSQAMEVSPMDAETAVSKAYSQFIDLRSPEEYLSGHAARSVNIPLDTLPSNLDRIEKNEPVYVICETGGRSQQAAAILKSAGFMRVLGIRGGTVAWQQAGLPMETRPPHGDPKPTE
jgi:rhodanese-related sulfurtransferase